MNTEVSLLTGTPAQDATTRVGAFLFATSVCAANVVRDIGENIKNLTGGNLCHYENLIERSVNRGLERLTDKAAAQGYNAIINVQISHPTVVDGAVSVTVYGNGCVLTLPPQPEDKTEPAR